MQKDWTRVVLVPGKPGKKKSGSPTTTYSFIHYLHRVEIDLFNVFVNTLVIIMHFFLITQVYSGVILIILPKAPTLNSQWDN